MVWTVASLRVCPVKATPLRPCRLSSGYPDPLGLKPSIPIWGSPCWGLLSQQGLFGVPTFLSFWHLRCCLLFLYFCLGFFFLVSTTCRYRLILFKKCSSSPPRLWKVSDLMEVLYDLTSIFSIFKLFFTPGAIHWSVITVKRFGLLSTLALSSISPVYQALLHSTLLHSKCPCSRTSEK